MGQQKPSIGVIGAGTCTPEHYKLAYEIGTHIADCGAILVCGGLGGIMEGASKGASERGGTIVGILPNTDKMSANKYVTIAIPTGLGVARNALVVHSSDVIIALPGSFGTLSEIAMAQVTKKVVVYLPGAWDLCKIGSVDRAYFKEAFTPNQAVGMAMSALRPIEST